MLAINRSSYIVISNSHREMFFNYFTERLENILNTALISGRKITTPLFTEDKDDPRLFCLIFLA